jgi:hypothetical protein
MPVAIVEPGQERAWGQTWASSLDEVTLDTDHGWVGVGISEIAPCITCARASRALNPLKALGTLKPLMTLGTLDALVTLSPLCPRPLSTLGSWWPLRPGTTSTLSTW